MSRVALPLSLALVLASASACHRTAPSTPDASGETSADAALETVDGAASSDASSDSATDGASANDASEDAAAIGDYVEPTEAEMAITSWTSPAAVAQLATSCAWMTSHFPGPEDERPLSCGSGLELQSCAPTPCGSPFVDCESKCGDTCDQCAAACTATCASCKTTCTDAGCRTDCARTTSRCREACVRARDTCSTAGCNKASDVCEKERQARWDDAGCASDCDTARACMQICAAKGEVAECEERCAKKGYQHCRESRADFLDQCLRSR